MWKDINSLSHTRRNCKYHIVFAPKYRRKEFYGIIDWKFSNEKAEIKD